MPSTESVTSSSIPEILLKALDFKFSTELATSSSEFWICDIAEFLNFSNV